MGNLRRITLDSCRHSGAWAPCPLPWRQVEVSFLVLLRENSGPTQKACAILGGAASWHKSEQQGNTTIGEKELLSQLFQGWISLPWGTWGTTLHPPSCEHLPRATPSQAQNNAQPLQMLVPKQEPFMYECVRM